MAENIASDTITGSGTEQTLHDVTGDVTSILHVDVSGLADGDVTILRAKSPGDGGTYRTFAQLVINGGQLDGKEMIDFGPHANSQGVRYTLQQPLGTGEDHYWSLDAV